MWDAIYKDIKKAGGPLWLRLQESRLRKAALKNYAEELASHPIDITHFVDYFSWIEDESDWDTTNGFCQFLTYGEIDYLWANPERFIPYESMLRIYKGKGLEVQRIFVIDGATLGNQGALSNFYRAVERQRRLGLNPRVTSVKEVKMENRNLGIACDAVASLNGRVALMMNHPKNLEPTMVRTMDPDTVLHCGKVCARLWKSAKLAENWFTITHLDHSFLDAEINKDIELIEQYEHFSNTTKHT